MSVRAMKWAYGLFEIIDLPPAERAVLLALCWEHTDSGGCFPSQQRISLLTGHPERKVRTVLKSLEDQGLVGRKLVRGRGKLTHTQYRLFGSFRPAASHRSKSSVRPCNYYRSKPPILDRRTGADYRGNIYTGGFEDNSVVEFSAKNEVRHG